MNLKKTKTALAGILISLALSGGAFVLPAYAADDVATQIAALMAQIQMLQAQLGDQMSTPITFSSFTSNLSLGSKGQDVSKLQQVLNRDADTIVAITGAGSKGMETLNFGPATKAAVIKFQTKHGITPAAGYVGAITRAKLNSLVEAAVVVSPEAPTAPVVLGSATVTASAVQPVNILAPKNATRIPFTKFTLTAGATDVTLSNVTVERTGLSLNSALESIVLLDESGVQIGISKTLNSLNKATVGEPIVIKAGTTRTFTVGANRPNDSLNGGTTVSLDIVAVNTNVSLAGNVFPIKGATHTINANLEIGTVKVGRGATDPGVNSSKEIGTVGNTFSSIKVTAGTAESLTIKSIKWNQTGSAGVEDFSNVKTYVDGVAYDTVSTDGGRYFTSIFGNGILVNKGFSKEISIKGDITGGSSREITFSIAKRTDLNVIGNIYGYGILPPLGSSSAVSQFQTSEDPWYKGSTLTMTNGATTVSKDTTVSAQNIAINLADQILGGWSVEVRGEPVSVGKMIFTNTSTSTDITNVILVDASGSVLAGPVDATAGFVTFTDSITFPTGITKFVVKGEIGSTFKTNDTIVLSTNPGTQWSTVRGEVTGNAITLTSTNFPSSIMTVKAGSLAISVGSQPVSQNVIAGATQFEFAKYFFNAENSGEDLRVISIPLKLTVAGSVTGLNLSSCQLYDGLTSVTTGSNVKNPTASGDQVFTFDNTGLVITKGYSKNLSLKCNVASNISGSINWGLTDNSASYTGATGVTSGQEISESMSSSIGRTMTLSSSGGYTVSADTSSSYNYRAVKAGTEVALSAFRFSASANEDIKISKIALQISNTASSSYTDLADQKVTLWIDSTQVGEAYFAGNTVVSTLSSPFTIPKNSIKKVVVKGMLADIESSGNSGAFLKIDYNGDVNGTDGNNGIGMDSGVTISGTSADTNTNGVRIFKNVPSIAILSNGGTGLFSGSATYKFAVQNPGNREIALGKVSFGISTSTKVTGFYLKDNDTNSSASAEVSNGILTFDLTSNMRVIPAESTKTYTLYATTIDNPSTAIDSLTVKLLNDLTYPSISDSMGTSTELVGSNIVWTPYSTTTDITLDNSVYDGYKDWTNSYGLFNGISLDPQTFQSVN